MEHWNGNVVILRKLSSLIAPKVVKMTISGAVTDGNFVKMSTYPCRWKDGWFNHNKTKLNSLTPRQNGRQFPDDIFKCIFLIENVMISTKILLMFVPKGSINNIPTLVQIMAWRRPGDKPLSGPMMVRLPTHICVTRPQWVNNIVYIFHGIYSLGSTACASQENQRRSASGKCVWPWTHPGSLRRLIAWRAIMSEKIHLTQVNGRHGPVVQCWLNGDEWKMYKLAWYLDDVCCFIVSLLCIYNLITVWN